MNNPIRHHRRPHASNIYCGVPSPSSKRGRPSYPATEEEPNSTKDHGQGEGEGDEKNDRYLSLSRQPASCSGTAHKLSATDVHDKTTPRHPYRSPVPPAFLGFNTPCPTMLVCSGSPTLHIPSNTIVTIPHHHYQYDYLGEFYYCAETHYGLKCPHGDRCCWDHSTRTRRETDFLSIQQLLRDFSNNVSVSYGYDPTGMAVLTIYDNLCDGGRNNWVINGDVVVSGNDLNKGETRYSPLAHVSNTRLMDLAKDRLDYMTRYNVNLPPIKKPSLPSYFHPDHYMYLYHQIMMQSALQNMAMALLGHDEWEEVVGEETEMNMDDDDDDDDDGITEVLVVTTLSYLKGQGVGVSHYREVINAFDGMLNKIRGSHTEDSRSYSITGNALAEVSTFVSQLLPTIISTCEDDTIGSGQSSECHYRKRRKCGVSSATGDTEMTSKEQAGNESTEISRLAARAAHNAVLYSTFNVGETVNVVARTWPGINKPGGIARVTSIHVDGHSTTYDVRYVLGGTERGIDEAFISTVREEKRSARTSRQPKLKDDSKSAQPSSKPQVDMTHDASPTSSTTATHSNAPHSNPISSEPFLLHGLSVEDLRGRKNTNDLPDYRENDSFRQLFSSTSTRKKLLSEIRKYADVTECCDGVAIHDSYVSHTSHIVTVFCGNYPPATNLENVKKRLLWLDCDGLPGEQCWRKVFLLLINMHVRLYGWTFNVAKWFVMNTTAVINRTPVLMNGSIRQGKDENIYETTVAKTDVWNQELIRSVFNNLTNPRLHIVMFGEPVFLHMNEFFLSIRRDRPSSFYITQSSRLGHMLRYKTRWNTLVERNDLLCVYNQACACHNGMELAAIENRDILLGYAGMNDPSVDNIDALWQSAEAQRAFATKEELQSYLLKNDMILVWLVEDIEKAMIDIKKKIDDDMLKQLLEVIPLVKCPCKKGKNSVRDDSVQKMIGGGSRDINAINCNTLTVLCDNKFAALVMKATDRRFPYYPIIDTLHEIAKLKGSTPRVALPYKNTIGRPADGYTIRKQVIIANEIRWKEVLVSGCPYTTASFVLGVRLGSLRKSKTTMTLPGNEEVKYLEISTQNNGTFRICERVESDGEERMIDSTALPGSGNAYLHSSHWKSYATSISITDPSKLGKADIIEARKKLGEIGWSEKVNEDA